MAKNKHNKIIGFVMDATEIRAVELSGTLEAPAVTAFGMIPLSPGLVEEGMIQNVPAVVSKLAQLMKENNFTAKHVMIGVKNNNVLLRMASFPKVPQDKLRGAVLYQAQQFIPIPVSELVLDFLVCSEGMEEGRPMLNVLLVGAKKVFVDQIIKVMEQTGLKIADIDAALLATNRGVLACRPESVKTYLLAHIDNEMISMVAVTDEKIMMTRSILLPSEMAEAAMGCNGALGEEACKDAAVALQGDILASISYFVSQNEISVDMTYLVGQYPSLNIIAGELKELTGLAVESPKLYRGFSGINTTAYSACISLALRGLEG